MRLARLGARGHEVPVVARGDGWCDARSVVDDFTPECFAEGGLDRLRSALDDLPSVDRTQFGEAGPRYGAPIARPSAIVCIGMNYAAHATESGSAPPEHPVVFLKHPNTLVGPTDEVAIPRGSRRTDWEVELGVVIGKRTAYVDGDADALASVAGYVLADDLSERAFQIEVSGGQWSKGKCCAGFTPCGPWLVTSADVDVSVARLRSWVNGEPRQDSSTEDMIFGVAHIIRDLSQYMVLEPGDLVLTGTPQGVALSGRFPYLVSGDVVEVEIDGLGCQRTPFVTAGTEGA